MEKHVFIYALHIFSIIKLALQVISLQFFPSTFKLHQTVLKNQVEFRIT